MEQPLISIIVPVYKVESYLDECVQSLVNQTYKNLEIILVDDGSPDLCPQMCDEWAQKDLRIKVIHKTNGGASSARNAALDVAKGEYFGFVDSDDYCIDTMYEDLLSALLGSEKKISSCFHDIILNNNKVQLHRSASVQTQLNVVEALDALFYNNIDTGMWSKLYDRELFDGLRFPEGEINEELPLWIPLIVRAGGIVNTGKALYCYRFNENSITKSGVYLREEHSGTVMKNLKQMDKQLLQYKLPCRKSFHFFTACFAFNMAISMEKRYTSLNEKVKADYAQYRICMWRNIKSFMLSAKSSAKDKVLYLLVLSRLLRPLYKMFYKYHL